MVQQHKLNSNNTAQHQYSTQKRS